MKRLIRLLVAGSAGLAIAACGSGSPEDAEQAAENYAASHGIDADVEVGESGAVSNVTVNTGGGQVGTNLKLPDGFPSDIDIPDDWKVTSTTRVPPDGFSVQMMSDVNVEAAHAAIRDALAGAGWTESASGASGTQFSQLGFEKDDRMASFTIIDNQGKATVQLITMTRP